MSYTSASVSDARSGTARLSARTPFRVGDVKRSSASGMMTLGLEDCAEVFAGALRSLAPCFGIHIRQFRTALTQSGCGCARFPGTHLGALTATFGCCGGDALVLDSSFIDLDLTEVVIRGLTGATATPGDLGGHGDHGPPYCDYAITFARNRKNVAVDLPDRSLHASLASSVPCRL